MKIIKEFPKDEPIVSMVRFKDYILVATSWHVFKMTYDENGMERFDPIVFHAPEPGDVPGAIQ